MAAVIDVFHTRFNEEASAACGMMCRVRRSAVLLVLVLGLAGCGGEVDPASTPAAKAQVRLMQDLYSGRFGLAYDSLLPAHRRLVSRRLFVECARKSIAVHELDSVDVLDVYNETIRIPAVGERDTKAVRLRLSGLPEPLINHELKVGERWYWLLDDEAVNAYGAGGCPEAR
jgi:hypothetical protein